jgi:pimeloyl-ACP methyl ester carboxylesterase
VSARRVLLPGLTLPPDDYAALAALLPGETVVLDTLATPVTGTTAGLRAALAVPAAPYELVGHSIGALAALEWAAQHPDEITRVVLLDPSDPFGSPVPVFLGGMPGRALVGVVTTLARSRRAALALGRWARRTVLGGYGVDVDPLSPARVDELFGTRAGQAALVAQVVGVPAQVARVRALLEAGLAVPRLLVVGSADGAPADGAATAGLAARLGTTVVSVPGGHLFPMTHPVTTAAAIVGR